MDHTSGQSQPQSGHRDMMFCHECHDEWYRDEHGLTCPACGSDFTEIIEDEHDPRTEDMFGHDHDDDESMPSLESAPHDHPLHHHNPWRNNDDPDEGDISNFQFRQLGPGRFAVTGTMYRTVSPADFGRGAGNGPNTIGGFASLLNNIIGGVRSGQQNQGNQGNQGNQENQGNQGEGGQSIPEARSGTTPGGHRFTYTAGARLYPRDANHPGPRMEPVDELNNVLEGLFAAFGTQPGQPHPHLHRADDNGQGLPMNPLMHLFGQLMGNGQFGDAVYSQEALDRIISQLMEQTATSNAPGPASQNDIDTLPRKQVTPDMLGSEGRAECSICMEEVKVGEEVAELPCHHWFHHPCVAAWLSEHDTCPHCRQGITKHDEHSGNQNQPGNEGASGPGANRSSNVSGEGTPANPFFVPGSFPSSQNNQTSGNQETGAGPNESSSGGGLTSRLRRGLFGPPSS